MLGTVATAHPADHSMWALFLQADPIVQSVMIVLLAASIGCWSIIFDKGLRLTRSRQVARRFAESAQTGQLDAESNLAAPLTRDILADGLRAAGDRDPSESRAERRERIERAMRSAMIVQLKRLESGLTLLATVGSTAPFIGLFGTVWGIMNSFTAIAASKDTSLAVVAPGIAEALLATAFGLVAAIPAVIAYNKLSGSLSALAHQLSLTIGELGDRWARRADDAALAGLGAAALGKAAE